MKTPDCNHDVVAGFAEAHGSAAKRAREVLTYCKLWTEGDMELPHLPPEKKCLEHRISVITEAIKMIDALPPNEKAHLPAPAETVERTKTNL